MASAAGFFTRVLAEMFPGQLAATRPDIQPPTQAPTASPAATTSSPNDSPRVIGQGASNETLVTIADIPNLFVDEGDCIVQFEPAFDNHTEDTSFGLKILPDLVPHWSQKTVHQVPLKDAIARAIRSVGQPAAANPAAAAMPAARSASPQPVGIDPAAEDAPRRAAPRAARPEHHDSAAVIGRITSWGEERFPDRKSNGAKFYTSFAMRLDTASGERTLQGEGLKEAISDCGCEVGDVVSVRRLRKIKVPAIRRDGTPKIVNGQQVMWDKWLWSISI